MALRFYIVPKVGTGTFVDPFRPKYFREAGIRVSAMDYGLEATMLAGADTTQTQHDALVANSDVYGIPPLDTTVGGNPVLNQTRNRLEQRGIPGSWIVASTTYRTVTGRVGRFCLIAQRLQGRGKRLYEPGVTLDSDLTSALVTQFVEIGQSFGLVTSGITTALTMRDVLILLADQLPPFALAGEVL